MQRKKKVETYDGESFAAAPQLPQAAYPSGAVVREHAQPDGSRPGVSSPNPVQGNDVLFSNVPHPVPVPQPNVPPQTSYSLGQRDFAGSYTVVGSRHDTNGFASPSSARSQVGMSDSGTVPLSPLAVPSSLRPLNKGIKRTPSAGILSALAVAGSLARSGTLTNASASPSQSVVLEQDLVSNATVALPQADECATSFKVCTAPIFGAEAGSLSEFDAIAEGAEVLESFDIAPDVGNTVPLPSSQSPGSSWLPSAQAWQPPSTTSLEAVGAVLKEEAQSLSPEDQNEFTTTQYTFSQGAYGTLNNAPVSSGATYFEGTVGDDAGDILSSFEEPTGAEISQAAPETYSRSLNSQEDYQTLAPEVPFALEPAVKQVEVPTEVPQVPQVSPIASEPSATSQPSESDANTVPESPHAPGSTWYDPNGYCYYLSPDGWKYWWDQGTAQWQPHEYVGTAEHPQQLPTEKEEAKGSQVPQEPQSEVMTQSQSGLSIHRQTPDTAEPHTTTVETQPKPKSQHDAVSSEPTLNGSEWWSAGASGGTSYQEGFVTTAQSDQVPASTTVQQESSALVTPPLQQRNDFLPAGQNQPRIGVPAVTSFMPDTHSSPFPQSSNSTWAATGLQPQQQTQPQHNYYNQHQIYPQTSHQHQQYQPPLRSACGFAKMTFGGRLLRVSPTGTITTHPLPHLPKDVLQPVGHQGGTNSLAARHAMLTAFPGPLGASLPKEKAAAFFAARKEACVSEEPGSDAATIYTLWSVLEAVALHSSKNPPSPKNGVVATSAGDGALAAALRQNAGNVPTPVIAHAHAAAPSLPPSAALGSVQELLLSGRKADALQAALQAHSWPIALVIAKSLGPAEWQATVEAYAHATLNPAAPLTTACLIAAGAGARAIPDPGTNIGAATQVLDSWREHAAMLAVGHNPGGDQALEALGNALLARGNVAEAHTCFILAGIGLQPSDAAPQQFATVGTSRGIAPRTFANLPAILRTEVFTWSRTVGNTQAVSHYLWVLPYKLLHAHALAEMGMLGQSAQYCTSILTTLQGLGNKLPQGLAVCRLCTVDLHERLQQLAAARKVSLTAAFSAGAIVSSVGKLLDRGISALMGGERQHSRTNSFTGDVMAGHSRRSSVATGPSSPSANRAPTPPPGLSNFGNGGVSSAGAGAVSPSQEESYASQPKLLSNLMSRVASLKSMVAHNPGDSRGGGAAADPKAPENVFYYDNELKIWRERGVEPPPPAEEPPPPPTTMPRWQPSGPASATAMPSPFQHGGVTRYANAMATTNTHGGMNAAPSSLQPPQSTLLPHAAGASALMPSAVGAARPAGFMVPTSVQSAPLVPLGGAPAYAPIRPEEMTEVQL